MYRRLSETPAAPRATAGGGEHLQRAARARQVRSQPVQQRPGGRCRAAGVVRALRGRAAFARPWALRRAASDSRQRVDGPGLLGDARASRARRRGLSPPLSNGSRAPHEPGPRTVPRRAGRPGGPSVASTMAAACASARSPPRLSAAAPHARPSSRSVRPAGVASSGAAASSPASSCARAARRAWRAGCAAPLLVPWRLSARA